MKLKPARILLATMTFGILCWVSEASWAAPTGHFGGGHFGGGGGHFGGGHFGGAHFGSGHFGHAHFGTGFGGGHIGGVASGVRSAGAHRPAVGLGGRSFNRNAFGDREGWNGWGGRGGFRGRGWGGGWGGWGWGGWAGPVFWPFALGDIFSSALWLDAYGDDPFWSYGATFDDESGDYGPGYGYTGAYAHPPTGPLNPRPTWRKAAAASLPASPISQSLG